MKKQLKQNGTIEIELVLKSKIVFVIFSSFLAHIKKPITNCNWLFYLYKKQKSINETAVIMGLDRKTIRKYRDEAHRKITEKLINGGM